MKESEEIIKKKIRNDTLGLTEPSQAIGLTVIDSNPPPIPVESDGGKYQIPEKTPFMQEIMLPKNLFDSVQFDETTWPSII